MAISSEQFAKMAIDKNRETSEAVDWACTAVEAYLKTLKHKLFNSRLYIIKVLDLISTYSKYDTNKEIYTAFEEGFKNSQVWVWLFWIPQLLDLVYRTPGEYEIVKCILFECARHYPQPIFIEVRNHFWYIQASSVKENPEMNNRFNKLGKTLYSIMNQVTGSHNIRDAIDSVVIKEFRRCFVTSKEEELYRILENGYSLSLKDDFKPERYFKGIYKKFFEVKNNKEKFMAVTLRNQFFNDFMEGDIDNPNVGSNNQIYYQEKLKKWKEILGRRLSLKFSPQSLVEISKKLANFNYRYGLELPGQYLEQDIEPFPEKRILIVKFEPNISHNSKKKIIIRTNTCKRLLYSITNNIQALENETKIDQMITQFKVFMNKILMYMNSESMRRGIKFGVFKKILFPFTKLCEDDELSSLDDIYKLACSECGIDPDTAT